MKNHPSDFDTPFGSLIDAGFGVTASCAHCTWIKTTNDDKRKKWSSASRARMGLQLHALSQHKKETADYQRS